MADQGDSFFIPVNSIYSFLLIVKRLAAPILKDPALSSDPIAIERDDLKTLNEKLAKIRAVISDAEKREISDESVKLWLSDLRDVEYMAVDIIEEFESSCRFHELCLDVATTLAGKIVEVSVFPPSPDLSCMSRKIAAMTDRCQEIAADRRNFRLKECDGRRREVGTALPPSTSIIDGPLFGREEELEKAVELLTSDSSYSVLPIVGMPGVGKTALVQHVCNREEIRSCFRIIWVCIGEGFDVTKISRAIIEGVTKKPCSLSELDHLQQVVIELLRDKKSLLVLDNVCDLNLSHWDTLQKPLKMCSGGIKIIVTSCDNRVAKAIGTCKPFRLECLSDDICRTMCFPDIFGNDTKDVPEDIWSLCCHSIERCKGLPLAVKNLGGMLRVEILQNTIERFLQDELLLYDELIKRILPVLKQFYDNLPANLKRCFAYCSLFPQGYIFEKEQLVQLWMAQGFIVSDEEPPGQEIEATGNRYFDELVDLSVFEISPFYDECEKKYVIHHLIHELAFSISGDEYSKVEDHRSDKIHHRTRHSSVAPPKNDTHNLIHLYPPVQGQTIRTLLFVGQLEYKYDPFPFNAFCVKIARNLFDRLECLRALDLRNTDIDGLPNSIGSLKHLHYLCLENTRIKKLPNPLCHLYKLQTLDLRHCYHLQELPKEMKHLSNLRHLQLPLTECFHLLLPSGIGKLTYLQTLSVFSVGSLVEHCTISELNSLTCLRGNLTISGLCNVNDGQDADEAHLKSKKLQKLTLNWCGSCCSGCAATDCHGKTAYSVLERLQPHHILEELCIRNYNGISFPNWLGDPHFSKLSSIYLQECAECIELPALGYLPRLKYLTIQTAKGVQSIGRKFCGNNSISIVAFPKLERLEFIKMSGWEIWDGIVDGDFPCLRNLIITGCPKLRAMPQLKALRELRIYSCEQLSCLPSLSALECLRVTGVQYLEHLQLAGFSQLEILEVDCCESLSSIDFQHLVSLRVLKITRCPALSLSQEIQFPSKLEVVHADDHHFSPHIWGSYGFQSAKDEDSDGSQTLSLPVAGKELARTLKAKRPFLAGDSSSETDRCWYRNVKKAF